MENYMVKSTVKLGPWGGQDGIHWDDGVYSTVRQVEIAHGTGIDSIRVEYDSGGTSIWSEKHGGQGGNITDKVKLEYPEEFLISMHGHYGSLKGWGPALVKSLTLISNKRTYGPYGTEEGTYFSLPMIGGKIVGFHGKGGWYLDAIGVHLEPTHKQNSQNSVAQFSQTAYSATATDNFGYSMIQGNLNKHYDVVIAVKQKDSITNFLPNYFSKKNQFTITDYQTPKQETDSKKSQFTITDNPTPKQTKVVVPPTVQRVPSKDVKDVYTYGPWGGAGGTVFDDSTYDGIRQIRVKRNVAIVSIKVCYDFKGEAVWGSKNGGSGSFKKDLIVFDYPSEVLTHISGYYGPTMVMGPNVIKSLTFHTTKSYYGPYGEEQGQTFSSNLKEGKIVGFHGRKGLFLDAIGVHVIEGKILPKIHSPNKGLPTVIASSVKPVPPLASSSNQVVYPVKPVPPLVSSSNQVVNPKNSQTKLSIKPAVKVTLPTDSPTKVMPPAIMTANPSKQKNELAIKQPGSPKWSFIPGRRGASEEDHTYQGTQRIIKDPAPHGTGPWGGEGGKPWDDGVFTGIRQIILTMSPHAICAIEIEYDRNGQSVWSVAHGANRGGQTSERVKLEFPHEVLTCVSGYYGAISKDEVMKVIKSLTFYTSRKKYGPFGEEKGTFFTSAKTEGKVVGLHGRSSMYLDAIGVHMQHWLGNQKPKQSSSIMKLFS